jgi:glucosylceramidase
MIKAIVSHAQGARWAPLSVLPSPNPSLTVNVKTRFQTHLGFGGAITEAAAYTAMEGRSEADFKAVVANYFGDDGLRYNLTRIHMNSSDFALGNYTYVDYGDTTLQSFNIEREEQYVLPFLREALNHQPALKTLISPWSPPAWMKTNHYMNHGGSLKEEFYPLWAAYFVKFIQSLQAKGIQPWGVSVQNEPAAKQTWDSCLYTPEQEYTFVKYHLGPALKNAFKGGIQLLVWDHNRDIIMERVAPILQDPDLKGVVWGTAFHWYGEEAFGNVKAVHDRFPDFHLLFTEGCIEGGPRPGSWETGERYARNIIGDFNAFNEGFIDWNLILNEQGGPNHVGNYCDAPILWDRPKQTLIFNSSYYVIGHFSRHIQPGATRVALEGTLPDGVSAITYQNPNGECVVVFLNATTSSHTFTIQLPSQSVNVTLPEKSVTTLYEDEN